MRVKSIAICLAALCVGVVSAQQQDAAAAKQQKITELKQTLAKNQAALKQYAWTETTQISVKGEVKKQEQKECQYGPDGKVQTVPLQGASQPQQQQAGGGYRRGGTLKKAIIEKKNR
jgi:outer membrane lipoprotein-sorting protein